VIPSLDAETQSAITIVIHAFLSIIQSLLFYPMNGVPDPSSIESIAIAATPVANSKCQMRVKSVSKGVIYARK
jgi:hypothetical protein